MSELTTPGKRRGGTVIIGAGVHGTLLAAELRRKGVDPEAVTLLDPNPPLARFERRCRACGMETMRSPFVQHLGADPFALEAFAEATGRTDEIVSHPSIPDRPSVDLFFDHASTVVEAHGLRGSWLPARALGVARRRDGRLRIATTETGVIADRVLLTVGDAGGPAVPDWAASLSEDARVATAWSGTEPRTETNRDGGEGRRSDGDDARRTDGDDPRRTVGIVGGGASGVTLACALADHADRPSTDRAAVRLFTRGPVERARTEADPRWMNWRCIERRLHDLPAGGPERVARVEEARNDGTVPPPVAGRFEEAVEAGRIDHRPVPVVDAETLGEEPSGAPPRIRLLTEAETTTTVDAIRVATGFDAPTEAPLVRRLADRLDLRLGAGGYPVLDDDTLAWRRTDGSRSRVFVSGTLASPTVGPFARNVIGARRAAERILDAPTTHERYDPGVPA